MSKYLNLDSFSTAKRIIKNKGKNKMTVTINKESELLAGNSYSFVKPITVLVGGNGSGKTSLLRAIALSIEPSNWELNTNSLINAKDVSILNGPKQVSHFFAENNLKHKSHLGDDIFDQMTAIKSSSGEATFSQVLKIIQKEFVILDEPDQSLDISNNYGLSLFLLKIAAKKESKIIISVHSAQVLKALGHMHKLVDVIDVETGNKTTVEKYIDSEKEKIKIKFNGI